MTRFIHIGDNTSWGDVQSAFGVAHGVGTGILSAFGLGSVAKPLEQLEKQHGLLAGGSVSPTGKPQEVVTAPDYVVVAHGKKADAFEAPLQAVVVAGRRFAGNGYHSGAGYSSHLFSFGIDKPEQVTIVQSDGSHVDVPSATMVIFLGGREPGTQVQGEPMDEDTKERVIQDLGVSAEMSEGWLEICGEDGDEAYGAAICGASVTVRPRVIGPRLGFNMRQVAGTDHGGMHTGMVLGSVRPGDHRTSIANARTAGQRAITLANNIKGRLAKATRVKGDDDEVGARRGTPVTIAQASRLADRTLSAGKSALSAATAHSSKVSSYQTNKDNGASRLLQQQRTAFGPHTTVHGDVLGMNNIDRVERDAMVSLIGASYGRPERDLLGMGPREKEMIEEIMGGDPAYWHEIVGLDPNNPPDPNNPGFLMDGSADPDAPGAMTSSSDGSGAAATVSPMGGEVAALGPAPTSSPWVAGQDYTRDPGAAQDQMLYHSGGNIENPTNPAFPLGAIKYDGSKGMPRYAVGSYLFWYGGTFQGQAAQPALTGLCWGWDQMGFPDSPNPTRWIDCQGPGGLIKHMTWRDLTPDQAQHPGSYSQAVGYGPLVGSPQSPDFANLRYDLDTDEWFWFWDTAPGWARAPGKALRLNQAILDYKAKLATAQANDAAAAAQAALDAANAAALAKQQAADDAATQHQQQQEVQAAQTQAQIDQANLQTQIQAQQAQAELYAQYGYGSPPGGDDGGGFGDYGDSGSGAPESLEEAAASSAESEAEADALTQMTEND